MTAKIQPSIDLPREFELASLASMTVSMSREMAIQNRLGGPDSRESHGSFLLPVPPKSAISAEVDPRRTWRMNRPFGSPQFRGASSA
jgi:hypothetical protein